MNISIGVTNDDHRKLSKTFSSTISLSGTLRNDSNIVNPSVLVRVSASTIANCNYMYISEFNRYYYITDITAVSDTLSMVNGHCDVLNTYKAGIRSNQAIVKRSSNMNDLFINDGSMVMKSQITTDYIPFPVRFTKAESIILVTV